MLAVLYSRHKQKTIMGYDKISYREFKERVRIADLVEHFCIELKRKKPTQLQGNCPFPNHAGDRNSGAFGLETDRDIYVCPTHCGSGLGSIDFYCDLMGLDRKRDAYRAVMEMERIFGHKLSKEPMKPVKKTGARESKTPTANQHKNIHLSLGGIPKEISEEKCISPETWAYFGAGIGKYGKLTNHLAIPMHNAKGYRIGYSGQDMETGNWRFYFNKSLELYNYHRVKQSNKLDYIILAEGFYSVMYLHQLGFGNVVASMGVSVSAEQRKLLEALTDRIIIFYDKDQAGDKGASKLLQTLPNAQAIQYPAHIEEGKPRHLTKQEISEGIEGAMRLFP
jgi:DNA primase